MFCFITHDLYAMPENMVGVKKKKEERATIT